MRNPHLNLFHNQNEQRLASRLIAESINIYGIDIYYLPKTLRQYDKVYGEDAVSQYLSAIPTVAYLRDTQGFQGDGILLTKFNIEVRNQITLVVSLDIFSADVASVQPETLTRPREGDLIYVPMFERLFQIRFVRKDNIDGWYQHGTIHTVELVCETFEYSNEKFATGLDFIDALIEDRNTAIEKPAPNLRPGDVPRDNKDLIESIQQFIDQENLNPRYRRRNS